MKTAAKPNNNNPKPNQNSNQAPKSNPSTSPPVQNNTQKNNSIQGVKQNQADTQPSNIKSGGSHNQGASNVKNSNSLVRNVLIVLAVILFLLGMLATTAFAISYDYLNIGNEAVEGKVKDAVFSLPGVKMPPSHVFRKTMEAQSKVEKMQFDGMISYKSSAFMSLLQQENIAVEFDGGLDVSKDIKFDVNIKVPDYFQGSIKRPEKDIYFIIKEIPQELIIQNIGYDINFEQFLNQWVQIGRDVIPQDMDVSEDITFKEMQEKQLNIGQKMAADKDIQEALSMEKINFKQAPHYLITFDYTPEVMKKIIQYAEESGLYDDFGVNVDEMEDSIDEISKIYENFQYQAWINASSYYMTKAAVNLKIDMSNVESDSSMRNPMADVALEMNAIVNFANYNKDIKITTPPKSMKVMDYFQKIREEYERVMTEAMSTSMPSGDDSDYGYGDMDYGSYQDYPGHGTFSSDIDEQIKVQGDYTQSVEVQE